jgi:hypothetical protein
LVLNSIDDALYGKLLPQAATILGNVFTGNWEQLQKNLGAIKREDQTHSSTPGYALSERLDSWTTDPLQRNLRPTSWLNWALWIKDHLDFTRPAWV